MDEVHWYVCEQTGVLVLTDELEQSSNGFEDDYTWRVVSEEEAAQMLDF